MSSIEYSSPSPDLQFVQSDLLAYIFSNPHNIPSDKVVYIDALSKEKITFGEVVRRTQCLAAGLRAVGVNDSDVVVIYSPNTVEYPIYCFGILGCRAVVAPFSPTLTIEELRTHALTTGAKYVIAHSSLLENAREAMPGTLVKKLIQADDAQQPSRGLLDVPTLAELAKGQVAQQLLHISPREVASRNAFLCLSSGTTGPSKVVQLSHQNVTTNMQQYMAIPTLEFSPSAIYVAFIPNYHIAGIIINVLLPVFGGALMVMMPHFELEKYLWLLQHHKATTISIIPPVALLLSRSPLAEKYDLGSLQRTFCTAAPLPKEVKADFDARMKKLYGKDILLLQGYGSTETSPLVAQVPYWRQDKSHTCGCSVPNMSMRLIDPLTGRDVPKNASARMPGEIWVRGPNVMSGSYRNADATEAAFENGWYKTGDLAVIDSDGYLTIMDRIKELIKYKGLQVVPSELENKILQHPNVQDATVVGVWKDAEATEVPAAFVVLQTGSGPVLETVGKVKAWFDREVANHQKLRGVVFAVEAIPKSASGKILRRQVKEMVQARARSKGLKAMI
ncbi:acetyl-CoA synthetase-like protein [Viridothelium virens]|uniref:Acetyl-CoA synthetase-like protein n=1 Tax=Viridothelium virens TaxID=1048519 RepID=A0A6A6H4E2_VIRVR|nr:acetyl-CoA synthetase-like protein [Viridothelium virens]